MRVMKTLGVMGLAAMLTAGGWAAQKNDQDAKSKQKTLQTQSPRSSDWVQREVRHELVMLPQYSVFDNLLFRIDGDKVTLLGEVSRPSLKSDAEDRVKRIEGVVTVDNQIEVLPNSPSDDRLRQALYRAMFADSFWRYGIQAVPPIHIIVKNGRVKLEGVVASEGDKNLAGMKANGVPGIFEVTNNLRVERD